jgi:hypothetical protein
MGLPVAAAVGGVTKDLLNPDGSNPGRIFDTIKDSIFSTKTLNGMISIGTSLAVDQLGLPPIASDLISGFITGFSQTKSGEKVFSKIGEGISRFTGWITDGIRPVVDFGAKILNGAVEITEAGFKSAINAFGSFFSRPTQEYIYQDVAGIRSGSVSVDGDIWTWQSGDSRIDYNVRTGRVDETFGIGGTAKIEGLGQDALGNFYYSKLSSATAFDGGVLSQSYESGKLTEWGLLFPDGTSIVSRGRVWNAEGNIVTGDIEVHAPPVIIQGPDPDPTEPPQTYTPYSWIFTIQNGQVVSGKVNYQVEANRTDSGATTEDSTQALYLLANGINNTDYVWGDETPDPARYYTVLQRDLQDRNPLLTDRDIVIPALYLNWIAFRIASSLVVVDDQSRTWWEKFLKSGDVALNRFKDVGRIIFEVQLMERLGVRGLSAVIGQTMNQTYLDLGESSVARPLIALGYSGGMPALINSIADNGWFTPVLVGVGAALCNITEIKDWLNSVVGLLDYLMGKIVESKTVQNTTSWLQKVFGYVEYIPVIGKPMTEIAEFLTGLITGVIHGVEEAVDFVINAVGALCDDWHAEGKIAELMPVGLSTLEGGSTQCFVNIFGEDDVLAKLRIGGKMNSVVGFSGPEELFNVQIVNLTSSTGEKLASADHYIYMGNTRLNYADALPYQQTFDLAAKNFVADLLAYGGTTKEDIKDYLRKDSRVKFDENTQIYRIYPLGVPKS